MQLPPTEFLVGVAVGSLALNAIFHTVRCSGVLTTTKQLAWVLTLVACVVLTLGSAPYVAIAVRHGLDVGKLVLSDQFSLVLLGAFMSYLVWDLVLGMLYYRETIGVLTGYVHHALYIYVAWYTATHGASAIFCLFFYNELPTVILAAGSMRSEWRSDALFALSFFSTRLLMHTIFLYKFYCYSEVLFVWKIMAVALPMHLYWFYGIVRHQLLRRRSKGLSMQAGENYGPAQEETDRLLTKLLPLPPISNTI